MRPARTHPAVPNHSTNLTRSPPRLKPGVRRATYIPIGGDVYQIDCGLGSMNAFTNAGLRFDDLKSMFITHLHTDHIVDYFSFFLSGGYTASKGKAPVTGNGRGTAGGWRPSQVHRDRGATGVGLPQQVAENSPVPRGYRRQRSGHRDAGLPLRRLPSL